MFLSAAWSRSVFFLLLLVLSTAGKKKLSRCVLKNVRSQLSQKLSSSLQTHVHPNQAAVLALELERDHGGMEGAASCSADWAAIASSRRASGRCRRVHTKVFALLTQGRGACEVRVFGRIRQSRRTHPQGSAGERGKGSSGLRNEERVEQIRVLGRPNKAL